MAVILLLDFPVNQEGQSRTERNNSGNCCNFLEISYNNGFQDLAAKLEFQSYSKSLCKCQLHIGPTADIIIKSL